jgi:hypothetical protein
MVYLSNKHFVICDAESKYASAFATYMANKKILSMQIHVCENIQQAIRMSNHTQIDYFLCDTCVENDERSKVKTEHMLLWGADVEKYSKRDEMLSAIVAYCSKEAMDFIVNNHSIKVKNLIAIYSPIHRIGKTAFAFEKGKELGRESPTLYLNMEAYHGEARCWNKPDDAKNLADVYYYSKQEGSNLGLFVNGAVQKVDTLEYILPIPLSSDLKYITSDEWIEFLGRLLAECAYENIVLDIDEGVQGVNKILEMSSSIYMPVIDEEIAMSKVMQFEEELTFIGDTDVIEKITKVNMDR